VWSKDNNDVTHKMVSCYKLCQVPCVWFMFVLQSLSPSGWEEDALKNRFPLLTGVWDWRLLAGVRPAVGYLGRISQLCLRGAAHRFMHSPRAHLPGAPGGPLVCVSACQGQQVVTRLQLELPMGTCCRLSKRFRESVLLAAKMQPILGLSLSLNFKLLERKKGLEEVRKPQTLW